MNSIHQIIRILICLIILAELSGCYYDNEEDLYPSVLSDCDTVNVSYSRTIVPIIDRCCMECHNNESAPSIGGSIPLEDYADVKESALDGSFYGSISGDPSYSFMPIGDSVMTECEIKQVDSWIMNGAGNN